MPVPKSRRLKRAFFQQNTLQVAEQLLGKVFCYKNQQLMITETEAYRGDDDEGSHAYKGRTPRNAVMYGRAGQLYVYLIYGMYHCMNIVTESEGTAAAVLIRGLKLLSPPYTHFNGPGKATRALGITRADNQLDIIDNDDCFICQTNAPAMAFSTGPRIGIKVGLDKPWRFLATLPADP